LHRSLKLAGVMIVLGAPAPVLAQTPGTAGLAAVASSQAASGQMTARTPARIRSAGFAARQTTAATRAAPRRLDLTVRGDDRLREDVELSQKDAWTDDEGFQFRAARFGYTRRF